MMYIKGLKNNVIVEIQCASAKPQNTENYTYVEISKAEYDNILFDFLQIQVDEGV